MKSFDPYGYLEKVRRAVLARKAELDTAWDPFNAAWLAYALSQDGIEENPPLLDLFQALMRWSEEPEGLRWPRHVGVLGLLTYLCRLRGLPREGLLSQIQSQLTAMTREARFSPLRDPEQVFLVALGVDAEAQESDVKGVLVTSAREGMKGTIRRRILLAAALRELGHPEAVSFPGDAVDPEDIIAEVWWLVRYDAESPRLSVAWARFGNTEESMGLVDEGAADYQRVLSVPELALLYESVRRATAKPDPVVLFERYPLHPRVREITEHHFRSGAYVAAVEQATRVLNEQIQQKSGLSNMSEVKLVRVTMKIEPSPSNPSNFSSLRVLFNDHLSELSGRNEQQGLALIAEGIFTGFRNPKGHKPEDHPLISIDPYEALDQLIVISYLMKRVEDAQGPSPSPEEALGPTAGGG